MFFYSKRGVYCIFIALTLFIAVCSDLASETAFATDHETASITARLLPGSGVDYAWFLITMGVELTPIISEPDEMIVEAEANEPVAHSAPLAESLHQQQHIGYESVEEKDITDLIGNDNFSDPRTHNTDTRSRPRPRPRRERRQMR